MSASNSKPRPTPLVVVVNEQQDVGVSKFVMGAAVLASALFNGGLLAVLFVVFAALPAFSYPALEDAKEETVVNAEPTAPDKGATDPFLTADVNRAALDVDTDIQSPNERTADFSVTGRNNAPYAMLM